MLAVVADEYKWCAEQGFKTIVNSEAMAKYKFIATLKESKESNQITVGEFIDDYYVLCTKPYNYCGDIPIAIADRTHKFAIKYPLYPITAHSQKEFKDQENIIAVGWFGKPIFCHKFFGGFDVWHEADGVVLGKWNKGKELV